MTEQQLAEIEARANAAAPGPWYVAEDGAGDGQYWIETQHDGGWPICGFDADMGNGQGEAIGAFLAAARTDVPALLAEVRRLRRELDDATRALVSIERCGQQHGDDARARPE